MADTVSTLLLSASVAATITLAIEYAAKPHLEVRKERLLHRARARMELVTRMQILSSNLTRAALELKFPRRETSNNLSDELDKLLRQAFDLSAGRDIYGRLLPLVVAELLMYQLGYVDASLTRLKTNEGERSRTAPSLRRPLLDSAYRTELSTELSELADRFSDPIEYLDVTTLRFVRRHKIRRRCSGDLAEVRARREAVNQGEVNPSSTSET